MNGAAPPGPAAPVRPVHLHVTWRARLFASPFVLFFGVGYVYAIVASVQAGTWGWAVGPGHGWFYTLFAWTLATALCGPCLGAAVLLWSTRALVWPDRMRVRAFVVQRTLHLEDVDTLGVTMGNAGTAAAVPRFSSVVVRGRTRAGGRTGYAFNSGFMPVARAVEALRPWVAARPELVTDELTRAVFGRPAPVRER